MTGSPDPSTSGQRPTLRLIAKHAGISSSAVSKALRHHPEIPAATCERVLRIAEQLGYRPDPEVSKLMRHLRQRNKPRFQSTIVALTTLPESEEQVYHRLLIKGARQRADELGYGLEIFRIENTERHDRCLQRILRSRGIEGILILPMRKASALTELLLWDHFSIIAATSGVLAPNFHRVVPNHFRNGLLLVENLERRGYRRIGMVMSIDFDQRTAHGIGAAISWKQATGSTDPVAPLLFQGTHPTGLRAWFDQVRPDAVIVPGTQDAEIVVSHLHQTAPDPVEIALADRQEFSRFAGIDTHANDIGSTAIDALHSHIQNGQKGVSKISLETTVLGNWLQANHPHLKSRIQ